MKPLAQHPAAWAKVVAEWRCLCVCDFDSIQSFLSHREVCVCLDHGDLKLKVNGHFALHLEVFDHTVPKGHLHNIGRGGETVQA